MASDEMPGSWTDDIPAAPSPNPHTHLTDLMHARRPEYLVPRTLRIKVGTWNIGDFHCFDDLAEWLPAARGEAGFDVYALGLQEVVNVSQASQFLGYLDPKVEHAWRAHAQVSPPAQRAGAR